MVLYTGLLFVVMELVSNNVIEIVLYGASTGATVPPETLEKIATE